MNVLKKPLVVEKPWGREIWWARVPDKYMGKVLEIYPGQQVSVHYHQEKEETMYFMFGVVEIFTVGLDGTIVLEDTKYPGDILHLEPGEVHSMKCISDENATIFEVSTDHPTDSIRVKDFYNRETSEE